MKVERLTIENFRGVEKADLDLSRPVTMIVGENGVGKSTVADALEFVLTGKCRNTTRSGAGASDLIRQGSKSASIAATVRTPTKTLQVARKIDHKGVSLEIEGYQGNKTELETLLFRDLGVSPDVLGASLRVSQFIEDPKSRLQILADVAGVEFDQTSIGAAIEDEHLKTFLEEQLSMTAQTVGMTSLDAVTKLGQIAEKMRRDANRKVDKALGVLDQNKTAVQIPATASGKVFTVKETEQVEDALASLKTKRDGLFEELGKLEGDKTKGNGRDETIGRYKTMIAEMEKSIAEKRAEQDRVDQMERCPTCDQKLTKTARKRIAKGLPEQIAQLAEETKRVKDLLASAEKTEPAEPDRETQKQRAKIKDQIDEATAAIGRAESILAALRAEQTRIANLNSWKKALGDAETEAVQWDKAVKLFRDGYLLAALVKPALDEFAGIVSSRMQSFGMEFSASVDGAVLMMEVGSDSQRYDVSLCSDSEKLRLQMAVLEAFANLGSCKVAFVDNIEILSRANRNKLSGFARDAAGQFHTLILTGSWTESKPPTIPGSSEWMSLYYWPEKTVLHKLG